MKSFILLVTGMLFWGSSSATVWHVNSVENGTDSSGFTYSVLHTASDSSPMSGNIFAKIVTASGWYDDESGKLSFDLGVSTDFDATAEGTLKLTNVTGGNPVFSDGDDFLDELSTLSYTFAPASSSSLLASGGLLGLWPGKVCCDGSGNLAPNSFTGVGPGLNYMTLWGANFDANATNGGLFDGNYNEGTDFGIDLRIGLSPVPVPAAVWLFGTALIGLFGLQRRKAAT